MIGCGRLKLLRFSSKGVLMMIVWDVLDMFAAVFAAGSSVYCGWRVVAWCEQRLDRWAARRHTDPV